MTKVTRPASPNKNTRNQHNFSPGGSPKRRLLLTTRRKTSRRPPVASPHLPEKPKRHLHEIPISRDCGRRCAVCNCIHCEGPRRFNEVEDIRPSHLLCGGCYVCAALACACDKKAIHMSGPGVWLQGGACLHLAPSYLLIFVPMCECCVCAFFYCRVQQRERERKRERGRDSTAHESLFIRAAA